MPHVAVRVTRGALVAHRYTYAPLRCKTSQYRRTFTLLSVSLWKGLADLVFDGVGLAGYKIGASAFELAYAASSIFVFYCFNYLFFLSIGWYCGAGVFRMIMCKSLSPSLALQIVNNNNYNNNDSMYCN